MRAAGAARVGRVYVRRGRGVPKRPADVRRIVATGRGRRSQGQRWEVAEGPRWKGPGREEGEGGGRGFFRECCRRAGAEEEVEVDGEGEGGRWEGIWGASGSLLAGGGESGCENATKLQPSRIAGWASDDDGRPPSARPAPVRGTDRDPRARLSRCAAARARMRPRRKAQRAKPSSPPLPSVLPVWRVDRRWPGSSVTPVAQPAAGARRRRTTGAGAGGPISHLATPRHAPIHRIACPSLAAVPIDALITHITSSPPSLPRLSTPPAPAACRPPPAIQCNTPQTQFPPAQTPSAPGPPPRCCTSITASQMIISLLSRPRAPPPPSRTHARLTNARVRARPSVRPSVSFARARSRVPPHAGRTEPGAVHGHTAQPPKLSPSPLPLPPSLSRPPAPGPMRAQRIKPSAPLGRARPPCPSLSNPPRRARPCAQGWAGLHAIRLLRPRAYLRGGRARARGAAAPRVSEAMIAIACTCGRRPRRARTSRPPARPSVRPFRSAR